MSQGPLRLKHPNGFFAAGSEMRDALALLSDGGSKLFVYVWPNWPRPWVTARAR